MALLKKDQGGKRTGGKRQLRESVVQQGGKTLAHSLAEEFSLGGKEKLQDIEKKVNIRRKVYRKSIGRLSLPTQRRRLGTKEGNLKA